MTEIEDEEFLKLLAEKQHREMITSLKLLVGALEKVGSSDAAITRAIQQNSENVIEFVKKIADQKPAQLPDINLNQDQVIIEIKRLSDQLVPFVEELKSLSVKFKESVEAIQSKKPTEWEFVIDRGFSNRIEKITAKPK